MAPSRTVDQFIDESPGKRADSVGMDVWGPESLLLGNNASWLARVGLLNVDVHERPPSWLRRLVCFKLEVTTL